MAATRTSSPGQALYLYMTAHPGKKLNFMEAELGQLGMGREAEQDWSLLENPNHDAFHRYIRGAEPAVPESPALYQLEQFREGIPLGRLPSGGKVRLCVRANLPEAAHGVPVQLSACPQTYLLQLEGAAALKPLVDSDQQKHGGARARGCVSEDLSLKGGR